MFLTALSVLFIFIILLLAEYGSRAKGIHSELTRKFIHISVGTFVAFWPFFLGWGKIQLLSLAFFIVIAISLRYGIFRSIHAVSRGGFGEILFAMVIGILAVICTEPWVFMVAMLHLSLGDGLAAIVGTLWGDKREYKILGSTRSMVGTVTFLAISFTIMVLTVIFTKLDASFMALIGLPILATVAENVSIRGTDNLTVPLVVAITLVTI